MALDGAGAKTEGPGTDGRGRWAVTEDRTVGLEV
jgi:hypothetical protein